MVDVDALMRDVRRRVAEKKARGEYTLDAVTLDAIEASGDDPGGVEELRSIAVQRVDLTPWPSQRPVVGPALERARLLLSRTLSRPLFGMAEQATEFNASVVAGMATLNREVEELRREVAAQREELRTLRDRIGEASHG
jgi:hypothetical protein